MINRGKWFIIKKLLNLAEELVMEEKISSNSHSISAPELVRAASHLKSCITSVTDYLHRTE
jgi:hypothetical protein